MKIKDFIDKMTEDELQSFCNLSNIEYGDVNEFSRLFNKGFEFDEQVNGYDVCLECEATIIVKDGKLIAVLSEDLDPFVFSGVIMVPGRDYISMFSTHSGESKREMIK